MNCYPSLLPLIPAHDRFLDRIPGEELTHDPRKRESRRPTFISQYGDFRRLNNQALAVLARPLYGHAQELHGRQDCSGHYGKTSLSFERESAWTSRYTGRAA
jgi:hypothetical protein